MDELPFHPGTLSRDKMLTAASGSLNRELPQAKNNLFLESGALTVLTGAYQHRRMRFVAGLALSDPESKQNPILWFSRYWTTHEVVKTLITAQPAQAQDSSNTAEFCDALAQAIECTEELNLHFETSHRSITEVVGHIEQQTNMHTPRLIVVGGLEHYRASPREYRPPEAIPNSLALLKDLAADLPNT